MKKILDFVKNHTTELIVCLFLVGIISYTTYTYSLPYKSYGDIWAHFAIVQELTKPFDQIGDPFFNEGPKDPHNGILPVLIGTLSSTTKVDFKIVMGVMGVGSVVFLYLAALRAYYSFFPNRKKYNIDKIVLPLLIFLSWESDRLSYAGYFSLSDIAITVFLPHIFTLAVYCLGVVVINKYFKLHAEVEQSKTKLILLVVALIIIGCIIALSHLITSLIFLYTFLIFGLYQFIFIDKFKFHKWMIELAVIPVLVLLILSKWPYFDFFTPFTTLQTVHTDQPILSIFKFENWIDVAGMAFLCFIPLFKSKYKKLYFLVAFMLFIIASYLYPIRPSSYWRFFPITLLPMFLILVNWFSSMNNVLRTALIFLLLIFGMNSFINKTETISYRIPISTSAYAFLSRIPKDEMILTDPDTSYILGGLTGYKVLAVPAGHWNPVNWVEHQTRYDESNAFWTTTSEPGARYIIEKYNVKYILIQTRQFPNFEQIIFYLGKYYKTVERYSDKSYILLEISK